MSWIERRISSENSKHNKLDWKKLSEKKIIATISDWCSKHNTVPMKDLYNIECQCGHSLIEHKNFDLKTLKGDRCKNKYCTCSGYQKRKINGDLHLCTTDGGWVNVIELIKFLKGER